MRRVRIRAQGWPATVEPRGAASMPDVAVKLVEITPEGARFIAPYEMRKGDAVLIRIEDPWFHEVVLCPATVAWLTPPPPVATTWVVGVEFVELSREHQLRIAKWAAHYTDEEFRGRRERSA